MKICFYARVSDKALFNLVEFYRLDIEILRQLGHEVICVNKFNELIKVHCDLYFAWWFGFGIFPALVAKIRRRKIILTGAVHTIDCGGLSSWPIHKRLIMKLAMKLADRNLFISKTDFSKLEGFHANNPEIIYCSVDQTIYSLDDSLIKQDLVVTITHLTKENVARKMLREAIHAFAIFAQSHPTYRYEIGGSGDAIEDVKCWIKEFGLEDRVILRGRVTDAEKIEMLRLARVYLQPSVCEGFGLAILEAKACGTPVVTSPEPCIVEINEDSVIYGLSEQELASALANLAGDDQFYSKMQLMGLENVRRYSAANRLGAFRAAIASLRINLN